MHLLAGVDEVGYGPRLGPLVVAGVVFEVPEPGLDLWRTLSAVVTRVPDGRRLPVCDSKVLFTPRKGMEVLERTALGFLQLEAGLRGLTLRELSDRIGAGATKDVPWFRGRDLGLPLVAVEELRVELERRCVRFLGARAAFAGARELNRRIAEAGNKHEAHFDIVADLLERLLAEHAGRDLWLRIGKLGGRTFYHGRLQRRFRTPVWIESETRAESRYRLEEGGRCVRLAFIRDGDATEFTIALASIVAKYLREGWMRLFNAYWRERIGTLRPTAGYGRDAERFFEQIRPCLGPLAVEDVYRVR